MTTARRAATTKRRFTTLPVVGFLIGLSVATRYTNSMDLFQVRLVEQPDARLIATSNYNYAITSPKLAPKSWRTISVNGDKVTLTTTAGQQRATTRSALGEAEMAFIEGLRDELANGGSGSSQSSMAASSLGPGAATSGFTMSSDSSHSTSMSSQLSSSYSSGGQQSSTGQFGNSAGQMSFNMRDTNNFSVSRSDFPFNWSRVFFNGDLVTLVFRNGDVQMSPLDLLPPDQQEAATKAKSEVGEMQRKQREQISNTMQHSMDMVSSVFNSIMGSFPKPPDYQSSVSGMFGNNFPFGPNNSPFSAASGWPFATSGGAGAMAFAGGR